ncbi:MAG TPA: hypothetical protein PKM65_07320 [Spirochaetota bacterium]|nr:hypothetical protein [Spirochaetota bacterium]HNT09831.1 hypothetical protein [Spirochaetota bacterium]
MRLYKQILFLFVITIICMAGCTSTYVRSLEAMKVKPERPAESDINYKIYYSVDCQAFTEDGAAGTFIQPQPMHGKISDLSTEVEKVLIRQEVVRIFNRNKLYLTETFKRDRGDYYLDITMRIKRTMAESGACGIGKIFCLSFSFGLYPPVFFEWDMYLNVDVYDSKPVGYAKPIAMYEYKRSIRQRWGGGLLGIPILFFGNISMNEMTSKKEGLSDAAGDMLLHFTRDVKNGTRGNITSKTDIITGGE